MAQTKSPHAHEEPNYLAIWGWLFLLTVLEIAVVYVFRERARVVMIVSLVAMALVKAALVALFFMHLKFERQLMKVIAVVPLIVGVTLLIGVIPDSVREFLQRVR